MAGEAQRDADETEHRELWSEDHLRRLVGQLFIVGFHGLVPSPEIATLIQKYHVGATILFQRNVGSPTELKKLTISLQDLAKSGGHSLPLFISIDQENGIVSRITPPTSIQLPGSMTLAATGSRDDARQVACATGEMLTFYGINMNYAPVADVNSEPKNPVIGVRSFGDDPETVGRYVASQLDGYREAGIVPCIKHFPGHGDISVDSHYNLPVIKKTREELEDCELVPFRKAIMGDVAAVMTAHISLPNVGNGDKLPASLKPEIATILRNDMSFEGLIVTDCLEMGGVRKGFGTEAGAVKALEAGADCVMICHTHEVQIRAIEEVVKAVQSGRLKQKDIEQSAQRIAKLKSTHLEWPKDVTTEDSSWPAHNESHKTMAQKIYEKSTTIVRAETDTLPLSTTSNIIVLSSKGPSTTSGVVESGDVSRQSQTPDQFLNALQIYTKNIAEIQVLGTGDDSISAKDWNSLEKADVVILPTENVHASPDQIRMCLEVAQRVRRLVVVATCDPYDLLYETEAIPNYIAIYESTPSAFEAAAKVLFGKVTAMGKLPVITSRPGHQVESLQIGDINFICDMWNRLIPEYPVGAERLNRLMLEPTAKNLIVRENDKIVGYCLGYTNAGGLAKITAVMVEEAYRLQGIGTTLMKHMRKALLKEPNVKNLTIGSVFPRFWPGVPKDISSTSQSFFYNRGFRAVNEKPPRDLWQDLTNFELPAELMSQVCKAGYVFAPWTKEGEAECLRKQRENFTNQAWIAAYDRIAELNQHHEVMVVSDASGAQVGWTLMCSSASDFAGQFAFLPSVSDQPGVIACVGVDKASRKKNLGTAMLYAAMDDMKKRGMDAAFIDWVVIRGFYEKLGFQTFRDYAAPLLW